MKRQINYLFLITSIFVVNNCYSMSYKDIPIEPEKFNKFVDEVHNKCFFGNKVNKMPSFLGDTFQFIASQASTQPINIKDAEFMRRFFNNKKKRKTSIENLISEESKEKRACYLQEIVQQFEKLENRNLEALTNIIHEQMIKDLNQPEGISKEELREKVAETKEAPKGSKEHIIPDDIYFPASARALLAVHILEKELDL